MDYSSSGSKVKFFDVLYADISERSNYNYYVVVTTFIFFNINAWMVLPRIAPDSAKLTPSQLWKWRNIANSLVHSILSGSWAIFNLWKTPELSHAFTAYTFSSLSSILFSVGYFVYDFFDMASNHRTRSTYELLIHHSLVTMCLGVSVVTRYYQGYAQIALLVEINSVFLHIRQLLIIQGWNKDDAFYKINSYMNLRVTEVCNAYGFLPVLILLRPSPIPNVINWQALASLFHSCDPCIPITDNIELIKKHRVKDLVLVKNHFECDHCTFIVFRLLNLVWLIRWLAIHRSEVSFGVTTIVYTAFAQIFFLTHSLRLFKKILISDGYLKSCAVPGTINENGSTTSLRKL